MSLNILSKTPVVTLICIVLVQRFLSSSFACSFEKHARCENDFFLMQTYIKNQEIIEKIRLNV